MFTLSTIVVSCCFALSGSNAVAADDETEANELDTGPNLMGWWKFDDPSGTTATDSSKHDRSGVLAGGLSFDQNSIAGRVGKALSFDGGDDQVRIADYKGISGTAPRTISVWIKTDASRGEIVSWGQQEFGKMWILTFIRGRIGVTPHGGYYYMADEAHNNKWRHVAAVVGKAELPNLHDDVTLYLDGKVAEVHRIGLLDLWPIETGAESDVTIGKRFKGAIDELRIYDCALTDEQVQDLYNSAK
jgi:hypothetical protein